MAAESLAQSMPLSDVRHEAPEIIAPHPPMPRQSPLYTERSVIPRQKVPLDLIHFDAERYKYRMIAYLISRFFFF